MGRLTSSGARLSRSAAAPSESGFRRARRAATALLLFAGALFPALTHQAQAQTTPVVTISRHSGQAATATEGATLRFTVSITNLDALASISVKLQTSGGAAFGLDDRTGTEWFSGSGSSFTYGTENDSLDEPDSDFTVTILPGTGYTVGSPASATVTIQDDDGPPKPEITIARRSTGPSIFRQGPTTTEGGSIYFTISSSATLAAVLDINIRYSGGAAFGLNDATTTLRLRPPGTESNISFDTTNDLLDEADSDFTYTILAGSGYTVGTPASATVTIQDNDALPGRPSISSVTAGPARLTVAWNAPSDPGYSDGTDDSHTDNTVTAYDVRHILTSATDKSAGQWTVADNAWTSGNRQYAIASLTDGQSYDVQVRAVTQAGDGPGRRRARARRRRRLGRRSRSRGARQQLLFSTRRRRPPKARRFASRSAPETPSALPWISTYGMWGAPPSG